jgi:hypothetical protein
MGRSAFCMLEMLVSTQPAYKQSCRVKPLLNTGGRRLAMLDVIAQIDAEIAKLQQARVLLSGSAQPAAARTPAPAVKTGRRGRPRGSKNAPKTAAVKAPATKKGKRTLTPEGRAAIAEAMTRRWAEHRKTAAK